MGWNRRLSGSGPREAACLAAPPVFNEARVCLIPSDLLGLGDAQPAEDPALDGQAYAA